jgi:hypothetical protein
VGIALCPDDGRDAETLIRNADTAMYHAKRTSRGSFRLFTPDLVAAPAMPRPNVPCRARSGRQASKPSWAPRTFPLFDRLDDYQPEVPTDTKRVMTSGVVLRSIGNAVSLSKEWRLEFPFSRETTPEVIICS